MLLIKIICIPFSIHTDFLREDTMIGTSFLRVAAHDDDYSTNAAITYSMSKDQPEYLRVNPVTGWVYVNQPISQVYIQYLLTHTCTHKSFELEKCTSLRFREKMDCSLIGEGKLKLCPASTRHFTYGVYFYANVICWYNASTLLIWLSVSQVFSSSCLVTFFILK